MSGCVAMSVVVSRACMWLSCVCSVAMLVVVSKACLWLSYVWFCSYVGCC